MHTLMLVIVGLTALICVEVAVKALLGKDRSYIRMKLRRRDTEGTGETPSSETPSRETPSSENAAREPRKRFTFSLQYKLARQPRWLWAPVGLALDLLSIVLDVFGLFLDIFVGGLFLIVELMMMFIELVFGLIELCLELMIPLAIAGFVIYAIVQLLIS